MKKLMIAALMMLGTSAAFAGDSEPLKAVLGAKDYAQAVQLLNQNLNQLANDAEKAKAYNHVTKLALADYEKQNAIQTANIQAQLTKGKIEQLDSVAFYEAAYNALQNGVECMKYDAKPNEKGKVKPKFIEALTPQLSSVRITLVNAGNYAAQHKDQEKALKYWGAFLDSDSNPVFFASKPTEKEYIGQVAYFSAFYASQLKQYDRAEKYADIAMQDSSIRKEAESFKYAVAQMTLKNHEDSVAFAKKMKATYDADPTNETVFGILTNMYTGLNMNAELEQAVDQKLAADPKNAVALATKARMLLDKQAKSQNPNYDESIDLFKRAHESNPSNSVVLTFLGFTLNAKAQLINNNPAAQKQLYTESKGYLENARDLDPNREQSNWAYPLYQVYYQLYGENDNRTKEISSMINK